MGADVRADVPSPSVVSEAVERALVVDTGGVAVTFGCALQEDDVNTAGVLLLDPEVGLLLEVDNPRLSWSGVVLLKISIDVVSSTRLIVLNSMVVLYSTEEPVDDTTGTGRDPLSFKETVVLKGASPRLEVSCESASDRVVVVTDVV